MEPYKVYMYQTNPRNDWIIRIFLGVMGAIGLFILFIFDLINNFYILLMSIVCLIGAVGYKRFISRSFILIDDDGISAEFQRIDEGKPVFLARLYKVYAKWEDIKSMSKEPLKISITLNDGSQKEIYIGDLFYKEHQELRKKLQEYIETKGISTTH